MYLYYAEKFLLVYIYIGMQQINMFCKCNLDIIYNIKSNIISLSSIHYPIIILRYFHCNCFYHSRIHWYI